MRSPIFSFRGASGFLSNFYPARVVLHGVEYPSIEHAYQAAKTTDLDERRAIQRAPKPGTAKALGQQVTMRPDWESIKLEVMLGLVRQKFAHETHRLALLATGDAELIEGNYWGDTFWGVCKGRGENHLGKILMQVRQELREAK